MLFRTVGGCPADDSGVGRLHAFLHSCLIPTLHTPTIHANKRQVGIISQNPEKSKHLETATMRVGSFWIDFVNLRTEAYTDGSRIPLMDIGGPEVCGRSMWSFHVFDNVWCGNSSDAPTPSTYAQITHTCQRNKHNSQEDALRRDLTINSLFYNVNTGEVEDFSGRGLADMRDGACVSGLSVRALLYYMASSGECETLGTVQTQNKQTHPNSPHPKIGIIRTPLPPLTTLLDDPLRVLRAVRFASRLDFRMSPGLAEAASDPRVHRALAQKVGR